MVWESTISKCVLAHLSRMEITASSPMPLQACQNSSLWRTPAWKGWLRPGALGYFTSMHQKPRGARRSLLGHLIRLSNLKIQSFRQFGGFLSDFIERITLNLISTWPRTKHYPFYTANTAPQTQCRADSSGAADVYDDDGHGRGATATGETRRDATAMIEVP